jgi:hypothetical protein
MNKQLSLLAYELSYLTTCTSGYFGGSSEQVIQVTVDENSTINSIKDDLTSYVATQVIEELPNYSPSLYKAAVDNLFPNVKPEDADLPLTELRGVGCPDEDDYWDLYMYFTLTEVTDDE